MSKKLPQCLSFKSFIEKLINMPWLSYHLVMISLVILGTVCNYISDQPLPKFWLLVFGFAFIIYMNIYSIKLTDKYYGENANKLSGEGILFIARTNLTKYRYSSTNWFIVLIFPAFIVPVVIYIIKYPLGLPIKLFAFTALYLIISLCFISYLQYVYLIKLSYFLMRHVNEIERYDKLRPHKTSWIMKHAELTNKQSNLFFLVGASFIGLLYLITFSGLYGVQMQHRISSLIVIYLWMIIAVAIVTMFPVLSAGNYFFIKKLISELVDKSINSCRTENEVIAHDKKKKKQQMLLQLNNIKILMLEKTPTHPQKPLVTYAISYIIAIINTITTVNAALSLIQDYRNNLF